MREGANDWPVPLHILDSEDDKFAAFDAADAALAASGTVTTVNSAAARLLSLDRTVVGQPVTIVFERDDLHPLGALLACGGRATSEPAVQEIAMSHGGRELQLAAVATALVGDNGEPAGQLLVLDDVTPLIRAQKVAAWREVAHELHPADERHAYPMTFSVLERA